MENTSQTLTKSINLKRTNNYRLNGVEKNGGEDPDENEDCDVEVCETLSKSFGEVQSLLDQNRVLIQQVNENHQSKIPDNLLKNVSLIQEINGNISKVVSLYSDLSVNFPNIVHQRRAIVASKNSNSRVEITDS